MNLGRMWRRGGQTRQQASAFPGVRTSSSLPVSSTRMVREEKIYPKHSHRLRRLAASNLFDPPDIDMWDDETLREVQEESGALFLDGSNVPTRFQDGDVSLTYDEVARTGAFCDRSNATILQISGADRISFLHNQSTGSISALKQGDVIDTVFVTAKAGIIDLATVFVQKNSVLVLASPGNCQALMDHLNKHIFPRDDVQVTDLSDKLSTFVLLGADLGGISKRLGLKESTKGNRLELLNFEGYPLCVSNGCGFSNGMPGYTWLVDSNISVDAWKLLQDKLQLRPIGSELYEALRLWDGKPAVGKELTLDYNPLEAGLLHCLDMDKGCSIGQEMIKRVYNRKGILKRLWGLTSDKPMKAGDSVSLGEKKIGVVTSVSSSSNASASGKFVALGYLKMQLNKEIFSAENERVLVAGNEATVRALPYVEYPTFPEEKEEEKEEESEEALEAHRREQKKLEMKARMEEWLKQSKQGG